MDFLSGGASASTLTTAVFFLALLLLAVAVFLGRALYRLGCRYDALMTDARGNSLETMVLARLRDIEKAKKDIARLEEGCGRLGEQLARCVQKVGVVRFNAFNDTGSDLSFAIALLDDRNNGVVISSIYGRSEAICYAKPINAGKSEYSLSSEEQRALECSKKIDK